MSRAAKRGELPRPTSRRRTAMSEACVQCHGYVFGTDPRRTPPPPPRGLMVGAGYFNPDHTPAGPSTVVLALLHVLERLVRIYLRRLLPIILRTQVSERMIFSHYSGRRIPQGRTHRVHHPKMLL